MGALRAPCARERACRPTPVASERAASSFPGGDRLSGRRASGSRMRLRCGARFRGVAADSSASRKCAPALRQARRGGRARPSRRASRRAREAERRPRKARARAGPNELARRAHPRGRCRLRRRAIEIAGELFEQRCSAAARAALRTRPLALRRAARASEDATRVAADASARAPRSRRRSHVSLVVIVRVAPLRGRSTLAASLLRDGPPRARGVHLQHREPARAHQTSVGGDAASPRSERAERVRARLRSRSRSRANPNDPAADTANARAAPPRRRRLSALIRRRSRVSAWYGAAELLRAASLRDASERSAQARLQGDPRASTIGARLFYTTRPSRTLDVREPSPGAEARRRAVQREEHGARDAASPSSGVLGLAELGCVPRGVRRRP